MSPIRRVSLASSFVLALSASPAMADCDPVTSVFFEYGSAEVLSSARQTLSILASQLPNGSRVLLRGHVSEVEAAGELGELDRNRTNSVAATLSAVAGAKTLRVDQEASGATVPYQPEGPDPLFDRRVEVLVCPAST
jgi:outer membrane protein OmpA-like peptidoglycan-associated protein